MSYYILKRDGSTAVFDALRIRNGIVRANYGERTLDTDSLLLLVEEITHWCGDQQENLTTQQVWQKVVDKLREYGYNEIANNFIRWREI